MKKKIIFVLLLVFSFPVLAISFNTTQIAFAQKWEDKSINDEFMKLGAKPDLTITYKSLKILGEVSPEYHDKASAFELLEKFSGGQLKDNSPILVPGNPFYIDKKEEYDKIIRLILKAKKVADIGQELEKILQIAEWRVAILSKSQTEPTSHVDLKRANTEDALKKVIAKSTGYHRALAEEKLENLLIMKVKKNPLRSALVIPEIQPSKGSYRARVTIIAASSDAIMFTDDYYPHDGPFKIDSRLNGMFPLGNGSVHRYEVECSLPCFGKYKFIGNKKDPLTFILLNGVGYVYLHGKGKVIMPDGKEVILPPNR